MESNQPSSSGRIPPQDIEAEKSLLGALLLSDSAFPNVLEILKAEDFYDPRHIDIFRGMTSLYEHHKPIDLVSLSSELKNQKTLKNIGGSPYLTEPLTMAPPKSKILSAKPKKTFLRSLTKPLNPNTLRSKTS